ncbi:MAG: hypothetical protein ABT940_01955 [Alphaproteobacteria bacterium]
MPLNAAGRPLSITTGRGLALLLASAFFVLPVSMDGALAAGDNPWRGTGGGEYGSPSAATGLPEARPTPPPPVGGGDVGGAARGAVPASVSTVYPPLEEGAPTPRVPAPGAGARPLTVPLGGKAGDFPPLDDSGGVDAK